MNFLVVGGDAVIGNAISHYIASTEEDDTFILNTTRRKTSAHVNGIAYLDLMEPERFVIKQQFNLAFLCAGVSGFRECERDLNSWRINVDGVLNIAMRLIVVNKTFVVYPSTQAVEWWTWSNYARQRAQVEAVLLATWRAAIVRVGRVTEQNKAACAKALVQIGLTFQPGVYQWP